MNRRKQYCINSIKALITAIAIILTSALSCVPACADTNDNSERIFYQFEEDLGEYAYADYTNSRYFILRGEQIAVYDAESDFYNIFYDFKQKSPDPDTFQFYDFYALGSKLYYLYQSGGASYVIIIDFNKLSIFKNKFTFPCTSVMATSSGDVLVYTTSYNGLVFMIKSDGSSSNSKMTTPIEKFYGEDSDGNIYFAQSNGVTFAKYDGKTFTPSNRRLTDVKPDLTKHVTPVEIFNKNMIADYSGNVFSLKNGATSSLFSFGRENYSKINYQGYGTLTVPITGTNYVIGMGENSSVELYDFSKKKFISSIVTRHNLYSIVRFGTGVICFEKDDTGNYVEIIPLSDFMDLSVTEVNLNNQNVYKGRTSVDAVKKYSSAISEFDLSASMLSDNGSSKAPYVKSEMTDDAQQALLNFSNYQRWLAGLSGYTTGSDTVKDIAAKGSILLEASPIQGHYPPKPDDMDDAFYDIAYKGTGGNISYGHDSSIAGGIAAIRALTDDTNNLSNYESSSADDSYYQGYNTPGHRNSFMQRGGNYLTYGAAFQVLLQYYEYAQNNPNQSGTFTENDNNEAAYAWPAPGAFPVEEIDTNAIWTVYLNTDRLNTAYKGLNITITDLESGERFVRNTVMHDKDGQREGYSLCNYWGKSISFTPPPANSYEGKSYKVVIENLIDEKGLPAKIEYTINMFSYNDTFVIDGAEYILNSKCELVPDVEPTTESVTTEEPTTEPVTTEAPTTEPVTTQEPTTEPTFLTFVPTTAPATTPTVESTQPTVPSGTTVTILCGDVNSDGKVNGSDAGLLSRYASGWKGYETKIKNLLAADINRDGKVNGADAGLLARYASGWTQYARFIKEIEITV